MLREKAFGDAIDFTLDTANDIIDKPTGWYGIKIDRIFDEPHGVLCLGDYGSTFVATEGFEDEKLETLAEVVKRFLDNEAGCEVTQVCVDLSSL